MGNCVSVLKRRKEPPMGITVAIIGLDNVGKTTLSAVLAGEQLDADIAPTVGFRSVKFNHSNFNITAFDLGGGKNIRSIWKTYFGDVFGVLYVLDSSSPSRLTEARDVFKDTLEHPQISGKPVLILANKVDKEDHMKEVDISNGLHIEDTVSTNKCPSKLVMVSALKGSGTKMDIEINEGLTWFCEKIRSSISTLEPRVADDMKAAKEARDKEREERRARVKKHKEEREKAEELERTQLGLKKEESEEEDIVDGNPFKALDIDKLKKKEQHLKEQKQQKEARKKEFGILDEMKKDNEVISNATDDSKGTLHSKNRMDQKQLNIKDDPTLHLDDMEASASPMPLYNRSPRMSTLPPLEPLGSRSLDLSPSGSNKKTRKKKKRLTDYHLKSDAEHKKDAVERLGLSLREPGDIFSNRGSGIQDLKSCLAKSIFKPDGTDEEEIDSYKEIRGRPLGDFNNHDLGHSSQKWSNTLSQESRDSNQMNGYRPRSYSKYQKSLSEITAQSDDEGIELDGTDNSSGVKDNVRISRNGQIQNFSKLRYLSGGREKKRNVSRNLSDEENDTHALRDTLRSPDSPDEDEVKKKLQKEIDQLNQKDRHDHNTHHRINGRDVDSGGYTGQRNKKNKSNKDDDNKSAKDPRSPSIHSPTGYQDSDHGTNEPGKLEVRRKKKRRLLRSNKLAPCDDDALSMKGGQFSPPRVVQECGSLSPSDADTTPSKNRNSKVTQLHRNISHDSDYGLKWGLAEDLPAVDDTYNIQRLPNFNSDDEDIVF